MYFVSHDTFVVVGKLTPAANRSASFSGSARPDAFVVRQPFHARRSCFGGLKGWGLDTASLNEALAEAKRNGITLRALVFINPGNPTGNCLTVDDLQQLVRFAYDNRWEAICVAFKVVVMGVADLAVVLFLSTLAAHPVRLSRAITTINTWSFCILFWGSCPTKRCWWSLH